MLAASVSFALAAAIAYLLTPAVWSLAVRTGAVDQPDDEPGGRHIHSNPPQGWGLAIFAVLQWPCW